MRVLVTGARGQVGNCLVKQLQEKVTLLAVDRNDLDITDEQSVKKIVSEFKPKYIINAAAHTAVDKAEKEVEQSYLINRDGPKYLAEAALRVNATILHISTDYVFSGDKSGEYVEVDKVNPQCVYGNSKFAGEEEVIEANYRHIILRTAWVFCEHGNNFVKTIINLGKERKYLSIVDDQYGGPTYAGDIAKTLISMIMQLERDQNASSKVIP
jgi:dTDP-4-dehydrorhamnose reductase